MGRLAMLLLLLFGYVGEWDYMGTDTLTTTTSLTDDEGLVGKMDGDPVPPKP
jgi:hypothetical protein